VDSDHGTFLCTRIFGIHYPLGHFLNQQATGQDGAAKLEAMVTPNSNWCISTVGLCLFAQIGSTDEAAQGITNGNMAFCGTTNPTRPESGLISKLSEHKVRQEVTVSLAIRVSKVFTLIAFLALMGCTTVYRVTREKSKSKTNEITQEEFFKRVADDHWDVKLVTGQERNATILPVRGDSISLVSQEDSLAVPINQIQSVSKTYYLLGLIVYPPLGFLGGGLLGAALGRAGSDGDFWAGYGGFVYGIVIGSVGGLALGIFDSPKTVYEFSNREQHH